MSPLFEKNDLPVSERPEATRTRVEALLGTSTSRRPRLRLFVAGATVLVVLLIFGAARGRRETDLNRWVTTEAKKGDLAVTVSANGSLQPVNKVDVGTELSGIVDRVLVDENDRVEANQTLAVLDRTKLEGQVLRSRASLSSARARKTQAEAAVADARARFGRLQELWRLSGGQTPSKTELDSAEATVLKAAADEASARAAIEEAAAALAIDETNLRKAVIRSPVRGVVLTRNVEPGQTVAAALQAPTLFTLAEDLAKMKLEVDVDEAEVASVATGLSATFTVDAHPGRTYPAKVGRVAFGSRTKDGVVTYRATLAVDNSDLSLRPGMTASVVMTTARRTGVLLVPNTALRFVPPETQKAPSGGIVAKLLPRPPAGAGNGAATTGKRVYVLRDGQPVAVPVVPGLSDGQQTEITGGDLQPGTSVVVDDNGGPS